MFRKAWILGTALFLLAGVISAPARTHKGGVPAYLSPSMGASAAALPMRGDEPFRYTGPMAQPRRDDPDTTYHSDYGDDFVVGWTYYDYQANGSIGKMLVRDSHKGVHFVWMKGFDSQQTLRHVQYNYLVGEQLGDFQPGSFIGSTAPNARLDVASGDRTGYVNMDVLRSDERALVNFHVVHPPEHEVAYTGTGFAWDWDRGVGAFQQYNPGQWEDVQLLWPHGGISSANVMHILSTESPPTGANQHWQRLGYWHGATDQDVNGWDFNSPAINLDTVGTIGPMVSGSHTSNKVVMAWLATRGSIDDEDYINQPGYWQRNNDIKYVVSNDGANFDLDNGIKSLTKTIAPRPDMIDIDLNEAYGDTFRPYCDLDIQFDPWGDDQLYAAFATPMVKEYPSADSVIIAATGEHNILWFWNGRRDTITQIYDAYYFSRTANGGGLKSRNGAWRLNADRPSIAFNPDDPGTIYVVWVNFAKIVELNEAGNDFDWFGDEVGDTSALGYKAADVMCSISTDYGITWRAPINLTNTHWTGNAAPRPGDMASEAWASAAYLADDTLHIAFVRDTEAGGTIQTPSEGPATNSPWIYQRVAIRDLPLNDPTPLHEVAQGQTFMYHNYLDFGPTINEGLTRRNPGVPIPNARVTLTTYAHGGGAHELQGVNLVYRVDGGEEHYVAMANPSDSTWTAAIPGQADGAYVWYKIVATNDVDLQVSAPKDGSWWAYVVRPADGLSIHDIQYMPEEWSDINDYSLYRGYSVHVTGVVTTPSAYNAVYQGFAIQDAAAAWSGVYVRNAQGQVNQGDRVSVYGTVLERDPNQSDKWEYETFIRADSIQILAQGQALPNPIAIDSVAQLTFGGGSESLEGVLVKIEGVAVGDMTDIDGATTDYWPITDNSRNGWLSILGLSAAQVNGIGMRNWVRQIQLGYVQGVLSENYGHYAIQLREPRDVEEVSVENDPGTLPSRFSLSAAYPNPFNSTTTINFSLPKTGLASVAIYDLSGRLVSTLVEGQITAGAHQITLNAADMATGVYVVRLDAFGRTATQKLVLMK